jgi:hypothetical protein
MTAGEDFPQPLKSIKRDKTTMVIFFMSYKSPYIITAGTFCSNLIHPFGA